MTTVADIVTQSARSLGYLGRTEVLSAADANDGLSVFNRLLDSWNGEELASYVELQRSFTLVPNTQTYTIGSGGTINTTRPYDIISAFVRDANNNDYMMEVIPRAQWDAIGQKYITSQIPNTLFYYSTFPLGVINIFPIPLVGYTVYYNSILNQVDGNILTTTITMPPGYERAYVLNLALDMISAGFPCLLNDQGLAMLIENASQAKGNVKRQNIKEVLANFDPAIVSKSYASYNIYTDQFPRN
jgi:hypothetical protein